MTLRSIQLKNFRAHADTSVDFAPGLNLLFGPNGAGKTNILEAIHYLCLTKSFVQPRDQYAVRRSADFFELNGLFEASGGHRMSVRIFYSPEEGKHIQVNRVPLERYSELIGRFPIVILSPEDHALTAGAPEERRRFLDNILSQSRPVYLYALLQYRRAVRQRNALLGSASARGVSSAELASWNEELAGLASEVITARRSFVKVFNDYLGRAYETFDDIGEKPYVEYHAFGGLAECDSAEAVRESFLRKLHANARQEREQGRTLIGPHRDELVFTINGFEVRKYASQGQHRTFGLALRTAQYLFLQDRIGRRPLLLLDDVFGNLDARRTGIFMELLLSDAIGQVCVTAAERDAFLPHLPKYPGDVRMLEVREGSVQVLDYVVPG